VATVPPDLGKEPTTILILETEREMVNKAFEDVFSKYYHGTYEIVAIPYNKSKYSDPKKYRFLFDTQIKFIPAKGMGEFRQPATYEYTYTVLDRTTDKIYGEDYGTDTWKTYLKKYVKKLEEIRKSNEVK
jgi:hypothetical protein